MNSHTMKSAIVNTAGESDVIELLGDADIPTPTASEVLIKVAYAPLNPLDTHARANRIAWNHPGFPFVPGFEFCGRIEAVGDAQNEHLIGKRVAANAVWGGNAEYAVAAVSSLVDIPDSFDWQLGATFSTCAYTAWHLVNSALNLHADQYLLVHSAAGAVGSLVMQIARDRGINVIGLAGHARKLDYVLSHGAHHAIDYSADDWPEQVKTITAGRGVDGIIDGNAGPNAVKNYEVIAPLGEIVYLGAMGGKAPPVDISMMIGKGFGVKGFVQYFYQARSNGAEDAEIIDKLTSEQWLIPIGKIYDLADIQEAHRAFEARELVGRTLIRVGGDAV